MELSSSLSIALLLLLAAGWLMSWHLRAWRTVQQKKELGPDEFDYYRRQFRRRMQTSAMLGLVGIGMLAGRLLLVWRAPPQLIVIFWGGVMLLVAWVALLAIADMVSTRHYFNRLRRDYLVEQARLQAELRRIKRARGNGQADDQRGKKRKGTENREP